MMIDINIITSNIDNTVERLLLWKKWHDDGYSYKNGIEDLGIFADFKNNECVNTGIYREENKELETFNEDRIRILFQDFNWNSENLKLALLKYIKNLVVENRKKKWNKTLTLIQGVHYENNNNCK